VGRGGKPRVAPWPRGAPSCSRGSRAHRRRHRRRGRGWGAGLPSPAPVAATGGRWPPLRRPWIPHPSPPPEEERPRMGCGAALTCARRCHRWWPLACSPAAVDPAPRHHRHRRRARGWGRAALACARRHWWPLACSSRRPLAARVVGEDHPEAPLVAPPPPTVFASGQPELPRPRRVRKERNTADGHGKMDAEKLRWGKG
jgi:hypothetical protein